VNLISYLSSLIHVSPELAQAVEKISLTENISKNTTLLFHQNYCKHLFFVEKGLTRGYYFEEGKEITNWFAQENEFATCFYAFVTQTPSNEIIETLEDAEVTKIAYQDLQALYKYFPETERIGRIITENYYIKLEERLLSLQFKTAKERYQYFSENRSSILHRASLGQIASYLGITQETLSRIRSEL
jgi:CRP-like cAMP-binding protein